MTEHCGGTRAAQHKRRIENKEQAAAAEAAGQLSIGRGNAGLPAAEHRQNGAQRVRVEASSPPRHSHVLPRSHES